MGDVSAFREGEPAGDMKFLVVNLDKKWVNIELADGTIITYEGWRLIQPPRMAVHALLARGDPSLMESPPPTDRSENSIDIALHITLHGARITFVRGQVVDAGEAPKTERELFIDAHHEVRDTRKPVRFDDDRGPTPGDD